MVLERKFEISSQGGAENFPAVLMSHAVDEVKITDREEADTFYQVMKSPMKTCSDYFCEFDALERGYKFSHLHPTRTCTCNWTEIKTKWKKANSRTGRTNNAKRRRRVWQFVKIKKLKKKSNTLKPLILNGA